MSDYNFLMESRMSPEQYAVLTLISRLAAEQGMKLYLVGGAVRDLTHGQQVVRDLDFIVEGQPQRILRSIPDADTLKARRGSREAGNESPLGLEFQKFDEHLNTSELLFSNGVRAEVAMSREEFYSRPGQRPEVRPATVFDDLKRRDFAIDAMAVSLHPNSRGLLLDPTNGAGDIERREIRALQSHGFLDDPSRIFRMLRLAIRLDFKADERTERWFDAAIAEGAAERLDANQQARELAAILREDQPGRVLKALSERHLLGGLDPKLGSVHLPYERFARVRGVMQNTPTADPFLLNFHYLVEKLGEDQKARLAKRIIGESKAIKLALGFDRDAKKLDRVLSSAKAQLPSQVYNLLAPQPAPLLFYLLADTKSVKVQNRIKNFLFKAPQVESQLPRSELQSLGVKPGAEFDRILGQILARQLDGKIKSHPQLMKEMRLLAGIKEPPPVPLPAPKKGKEAPPEPPPVQSRKKGAESGGTASPQRKVKGAVRATGTAPPVPAAANHSASKPTSHKAKRR